MSPFPPLLQPVITQLIFFSPSPSLPTSGSCYSSNNNLSWLLVPLQRSCRENQRKSAVFYDLSRLFDLRLLEGSTDVMPTSEMDYELCAVLGWRRQLSGEDGRRESQLIGKQTASAARASNAVSAATFRSSRCHVGSIEKSDWGKSRL